MTDAAAAEEVDLRPLRRFGTASGFKGVTKTSSGKFQARSLSKIKGEQRGLGSFKSAVEAARAVIMASRADHAWSEPKKKRAPRGLVCCPLPCFFPTQ